MCLFRKNHEKAMKRMEWSALSALKLYGCAMSRDELGYRARLPKDVIDAIITRLVNKSKIEMIRTRDKKTGIFTGVKYCEKR